MGATALVAAFTVANAAHAQTAAAGVSAGPAVAPAPQTEEIEVTGTRIKNTNANSNSPITVITAKQIQQSSAQTIEDVLQKDVSFGSSGLYGATNNGGDGLSCTDIRNLGIDRVLVLVDGKRFVHDSDGVDDCVDLNNIPLQMIDHIEVLKDGASSTYGADAVSGVVNVITKKNITGVTATLNGDLPTRGGGSTGELSVTTGTNFDKGNIALSFDYLNRAPVSQGRRNWARNLDEDDAPGDHSTAGSSFTVGGDILGSENGSIDRTQVDPDGSYHDFRRSDEFNFAPIQDLVGGLEKESLAVTGKYDFNEYMTGFVEAFYTHKLTTEQLAPEPVYATSSQVEPTSGFIVPYGNPYIPAGIAAQLTGPGDNLVVRKRLSELGPREYSQDTNTFQITTGIRGTLPYDIDYETYYNYGRSDNTIQTKNNVNIQNLENVVGYSFTPGANSNVGVYDPSVCQGSCVLSNPFALSNAASKYIEYTQTDTSLFNIRDYGADFSKSHVMALPYGDLGLAFGFDHREESGSYHQDNLVQTGLTNEAPQPPTQGGFDVTEVYAEAKVPILKDLPFAKLLDLDASGRYFTYNTSAGSGETWKVSGNYEPIKDIRFRASIGTAFRQPNVSELYGGDISSANPASDPCYSTSVNGPTYAAQNYTKAQAALAAAYCAKQGVAPGLLAPDNQISTIIGGNPTLSPEHARTETIGMVLKPRYVPNLNFTVDWWRTKIANSIGSIGTQDILDNCYQSGGTNAAFCNLIGPRSGIGLISNILDTDQNEGVILTDGIDFGLNYNFPLGDYGAISEDNDFQYLLKYKSQDITGGPFTNYTGILQDELNGSGFPRYRDNNTVSWSNGMYTVAYATRFISGMNFEFNTQASGARVYKTANVIYHDIEGTVNYKSAQVTVGIDNILDEPPPYVPDDTTDTAPQVYDVVGRTVYLKCQVKF